MLGSLGFGCSTEQVFGLQLSIPEENCWKKQATNSSSEDSNIPLHPHPKLTQVHQPFSCSRQRTGGSELLHRELKGGRMPLGASAQTIGAEGTDGA